MFGTLRDEIVTVLRFKNRREKHLEKCHCTWRGRYMYSCMDEKYSLTYFEMCCFHCCYYTSMKVNHRDGAFLMAGMNTLRFLLLHWSLAGSPSVMIYCAKNVPRSDFASETKSALQCVCICSSISKFKSEFAHKLIVWINHELKSSNSNPNDHTNTKPNPN